LPLTVYESKNMTGTAETIVFICDDSVFYVHEAITSVWILKGTATGKVFFIKVKLLFL
jgi:hypothetical protein